MNPAADALGNAAFGFDTRWAAVATAPSQVVPSPGAFNQQRWGSVASHDPRFYPPRPPLGGPPAEPKPCSRFAKKGVPLEERLRRAEDELRLVGPMPLGTLGGKLQLKRTDFDKDCCFVISPADHNGQHVVSLRTPFARPSSSSSCTREPTAEPSLCLRAVQSTLVTVTERAALDREATLLMHEAIHRNGDQLTEFIPPDWSTRFKPALGKFKSWLRAKNGVFTWTRAGGGGHTGMLVGFVIGVDRSGEPESNSVSPLNPYSEVNGLLGEDAMAPCCVPTRTPKTKQTGKTDSVGNEICKAWNDRRGCDKECCPAGKEHICDVLREDGEVCGSFDHTRLRCPHFAVPMRARYLEDGPTLHQRSAHVAAEPVLSEPSSPEPFTEDVLPQPLSSNPFAEVDDALDGPSETSGCPYEQLAETDDATGRCGGELVIYDQPAATSQLDCQVLATIDLEAIEVDSEGEQCL